MSVLLIEGFEWFYPKSDGFAIRIDRLRIEKGRNIYLTGLSGCGKSTFLNLLAGVIESELVAKRAAVFPQIAYVMHGSTLAPWLRLSQNVWMEEQLRCTQVDWEILRKLLAVFGLDWSRLAGLFPRQISLGMRQRFEIAKAAAFRPDLLILDEGFSGIDNKTRTDVMLALDDELRKQGYSLIFTSHSPIDGLRLADHFVQVTEGKVSDLRYFPSRREERMHLSATELLHMEKTELALIP